MTVIKKIILNDEFFSEYFQNKIFFMTNIIDIKYENEIYSIMKDSNNSQFIFKNNKFCSFDDKPAIHIPSEMVEIWYLDNLIHRENKPALIIFNKEYYFFKNKKVSKDQIYLIKNVENF
jgi:hypothetical protein